MVAFRRLTSALLIAMAACAVLGGCASLTVAGGAIVSDGDQVRGRVGSVKIGG